MTVDHVLPRSKGCGPSTWENLVCACIALQQSQKQPHARTREHAAATQTQSAEIHSVDPCDERNTLPGEWHKFLFLYNVSIDERVGVAGPIRRPCGMPSHVDQSRTPYFDVLLDYVDSGVIPFHTAGSHARVAAWIGRYAIFSATTCSLSISRRSAASTISCNPPKRSTKRSGSRRKPTAAINSFFLINGSTSGNQIMMMTALNPGDELAVPRNSHKSAMGGLIMSGAHPVWMGARSRRRACTWIIPSRPRRCATRSTRIPRIKAVYIVSPTYYGVAGRSRLYCRHRGTSAGCRSSSMRAWGPHFHFHPALPIRCARSRRRHVHQLDAQDARQSLANRDAASAGASASASIALNPSSSYFFLRRLISCSSHRSTSPRRQMAMEGSALLSRTIELANDTRRRLNEIDGITCFGEEEVGRPGVFDLDPTKITITVKRTRLYRVRSGRDLTSPLQRAVRTR